MTGPERPSHLFRRSEICLGLLLRKKAGKHKRRHGWRHLLEQAGKAGDLRLVRDIRPLQSRLASHRQWLLSVLAVRVHGFRIIRYQYSPGRSSRSPRRSWLRGPAIDIQIQIPVSVHFHSIRRWDSVGSQGQDIGIRTQAIPLSPVHISAARKQLLRREGGNWTCRIFIRVHLHRGLVRGLFRPASLPFRGLRGPAIRIRFALSRPLPFDELLCFAARGSSPDVLEVARHRIFVELLPLAAYSRAPVRRWSQERYVLDVHVLMRRG